MKVPVVEYAYERYGWSDQASAPRAPGRWI